MVNILYLFDNGGNKSIRNVVSVVFGPLILVMLVFYLGYLCVTSRRIFCIVTYGKAASTSLLRSISLSGERAFQIHYITWTKLVMELFSNLFSRKFAVPLHIYVALALRIVSMFVSKSKLKFLIIVREDSLRWLSDYLQNLDRYGKIELERDDWKELLKERQNFLNRRYEGWVTTEMGFVRDNYIDHITLNYNCISEWPDSLEKRYRLEILLNRDNNSERKYYAAYKSAILKKLKYDSSFR